ncbi:MAG: hypothetical protein UHY68_06735 [Acutalibacteraceae bacterium]|nr:hypothetical protein [Acutalibacteraceae bacterium]
MYNNLIIFRNELKMKSIPKYKLIGIVTEMLFSKELYKKNTDIVPFLNEVFDITFKFYILKSRTMIVAKVCRLINNLESTKDIQKKLYKYISERINHLKNESNDKKKNDFDGWLY